MKKEYELNDIVEMKKQHPCGNSNFQIIRMGADIKIKCTECARTIMMTRRDFEKRMKRIITKKNGN
ncbi:DUF951 domain-containing protein [Lacicoccus alkaliphilus]|uniref:DUF951 domain-containing protein n=1 Tax=Lacicoccus alkaliphilus DSM 16010 TaxID=1123231 RepID=A0A1M7GGA6_9BACL|nr:DUF951 domain-containing protein [Salinicoccus alkaliphilus]SHM15165.1 hypothetical protein SAMN02745189_01634 [Salinicoccus alkaliphilus DSM 16010]